MSVVGWSKTMMGRVRAAISWPRCGPCSTALVGLTQGAMSAIQVHDMALCRPLLEEAPVLRAGDLLLEDRGCIDGAMVSHLKRQRQVDVIMPLKANMLATQEAIQLAAMADKWEAHPSRANQPIAWVHGVEHMWPERAVPLNACVIRFWN